MKNVTFWGIAALVLLTGAAVWAQSGGSFTKSGAGNAVIYGSDAPAGQANEPP